LSSRDASHPYIGFIVGEFKEIFYLMDSGQAGIALKNMAKLLHTVEPDARKKENWRKLDSEIYKALMARKSVEDTDPLVLQTRLASFDYEFEDGYLSIFSQLWMIFWDNGYMYDKKFTSFFDPALGRKSGERFVKK